MYQSNIWTLLNSVLQKMLLLILLCGSVDLYGQTFTKVATGDIVNDNSRSTGGSWADYDHDGYLDLFVSNGNQNVQNNLLYLNDQTGSLIKIDT